ncbi:MAG: hypothetical protein HZB29_14310 [Nitrospinae bacterium]|nr:hypothetical protein [Nitrospinota bacterium]
MSCLIMFASAANSFSAVTPDKKQCVSMYIDEQGLMQFGSYEIFVEGKEGQWTSAGKITDGKNYVGKQLDLSKFLKPGKAANVRIVNTDGNAAHIDYVAVGGAAPSRVMVNGAVDEKALGKLAKADMDVIPAHEKIIELTFPANRKDATLVLSARIEALNISPYDFKFPVENAFKDIGAESKFFTYEMDSSVGKLSLKGKSGEIGGAAPLFKEFTLSASGHPSAFTYGWVMNDDKYLYIAIDFTGDNTMDGDKDYSKVFVKIGGKVKEFKLSEGESKWGKPSFTYTDKVAYQHKYYEYRIPLEEVSGKESKNLELAFAAYGTCGGLPTFTGANPYDFGNIAVGSSSSVNVTLDSSNGVNYVVETLNLTTGVNFSKNNGTCTPTVTQVGVGTCTFSITFSPTALGALADSVTTNFCGQGPTTLNLSGTGVAAAVNPTVIGCTDPNAINYNPSANQDDGSCVLPQSNITTPGGGTTSNIGAGGGSGGSTTTGNVYTETITLTNDGNASLYIYGMERMLGRAVSMAMTQGGGIVPPFYITQDNCSGKILQPRDTCTIDTVFFPIENGTYEQSFVLSTNSGQRLTYNLTGTSISVEGNSKPAAFTTAGSSVDGTGVTLSWNAATDPDNDTVSYNVQYCDHSSFANCAPQSASGATTASVSKAKYSLSMAGALMVFGFMAFGGMRPGRMKVLALVLALSFGALAQSCGGGSSSSSTDASAPAKQTVVSQSFTGLDADTTYYWKVVASDGRGGAVESDTQTFVTGH